METNTTNIGFEEDHIYAIINTVRRLKNNQAAYVRGITGGVNM